MTITEFRKKIAIQMEKDKEEILGLSGKLDRFRAVTEKNRRYVKIYRGLDDPGDSEYVREKWRKIYFDIVDVI